MDVGAFLVGDVCKFRVWAPACERMELELISGARKGVHAMQLIRHGYWEVELEGISRGDEYFYILDGKKRRPDPASNYQPRTVHDASAVVDHHVFNWNDNEFKGIEQNDLVFYELHVGTFTPEGTYEAVIGKLPHLKELGVTAIELMPVAQFPGGRNWGYDGVFPFAPQNSYGTPDQLKKLVNACHMAGFAVGLDVVYNHFGPEGSYHHEYGYYYTDNYKTPWGAAINFDDSGADSVRHYFIQNALYWMDIYHIDFLRLDAVHAIFDFGAVHFMQELSEAVDELAERTGVMKYIFPEAGLNDPRLIRSRDMFGYGAHGQWSDDFHHSLRSYLTGDVSGYFADYGSFDHVVDSYANGWSYDWKYSECRNRRFGASAAGLPGERFVVFMQNHDQVGNTMMGDRLSTILTKEKYLLGSATYLLSSFLPMVFQGEEFWEKNPFLFFVSHGDEELIEAVREGRKKEFASFNWVGEPPDPFAEETFNKSKVNWDLLSQDEHREVFEYYKKLIRIRKEIPAFQDLSKRGMHIMADYDKNLLIVKRKNGDSEALLFFNFTDSAEKVEMKFAGNWRVFEETAMFSDIIQTNLDPWSFKLLIKE